MSGGAHQRPDYGALSTVTIVTQRSPLSSSHYNGFATSQQELGSPLAFWRLGVEEGGEGLEFGSKVASESTYTEPRVTPACSLRAT